MTEIKTSFSAKYIGIIIITAIITSVTSYLIDYYKEQKNKKLLQISLINGGNNQISNFDKEVLNVKYNLKKDSSSVKSFFQKSVVITNIGQIGIENLKVNFTSNNPDIILLERPTIETFPSGLETFMNLKFNYISKNKHLLEIPLLNSQESIIVNYKAYSSKEYKYLSLNAIVRQKDLIIEKSNSLIIKENDFKYKEILIIGTTIIVLFLGLTLIFLYIFIQKKKDDYNKSLINKNIKIIEEEKIKIKEQA